MEARVTTSMAHLCSSHPHLLRTDSPATTTHTTYPALVFPNELEGGSRQPSDENNGSRVKAHVLVGAPCNPKRRIEEVLRDGNPYAVNHRHHPRRHLSSMQCPPLFTASTVVPPSAVRVSPHPWFHLNLPREHATYLLELSGRVGDFLVRGDGSLGESAISVLTAQGVEHYAISWNRMLVVWVSEVTCGSLNELVRHHQNVPLSQQYKHDIEKVILVEPLIAKVGYWTRNNHTFQPKQLQEAVSTVLLATARRASSGGLGEKSKQQAASLGGIAAMLPAEIWHIVFEFWKCSDFAVTGGTIVELPETDGLFTPSRRFQPSLPFAIS